MEMLDPKRMQALILLAHGSRHPATAREVAALAAIIERAVSPNIVRYAFLEMAYPTLGEAIKQAVDDGASDVNVLPLFLNSGNQVVRNIPSWFLKLDRFIGT